MSRYQLMQSTQVAYQLNVIVTVPDDSSIETLSRLLDQIVAIISAIWVTWQIVHRIALELSTLVNDIAEAVTFTAKVFAIGFNSLAYGLGVTL